MIYIYQCQNDGKITFRPSLGVPVHPIFISTTDFALYDALWLCPLVFLFSETLFPPRPFAVISFGRSQFYSGDNCSAIFIFIVAISLSRKPVIRM